MRTSILHIILLGVVKVHAEAGIVPSPNFFRPNFSYSALPEPPVLNINERLPVVNPIDPSASLEGEIFGKLKLLMTPVMNYFSRNSPKFELWNNSIELIMTEDLKKDIVSEVYSMQPPDDRELKNFWGQTFGELMLRALPDVDKDIIALDRAMSLENSRAAQIYELKELDNKRLDGYAEFLGAAKIILDSFRLGISDLKSENYSDVIPLFLNASVAYKTLKQRILDVI